MSLPTYPSHIQHDDDDADMVKVFLSFSPFAHVMCVCGACVANLCVNSCVNLWPCHTVLIRLNCLKVGVLSDDTV